MTRRVLHDEQPDTFSFSEENRRLCDKIISKYPKGRQASAVIPLLDLAQRQVGWVTKPAIETVADILAMPYIKVLEVATFYTMFNLQPVGLYNIQVCTSLSCWLRGSDGIVAACKARLGVEIGGLSSDKKFSLLEVECAGACVNAPVIAINDDYFEDLTTETMTALIDDLESGASLVHGSMTSRSGSAPIGTRHSLKDNPEDHVFKQDFALARKHFEYKQNEVAKVKDQN